VYRGGHASTHAFAAGAAAARPDPGRRPVDERGAAGCRVLAAVPWTISRGGRGRPAPARAVEPHGECRLGRRRARRRLELASRLGRPGFRHQRDQHGPQDPPKPGFYLGDWPALHDPAPVDGVRLRRGHGGACAGSARSPARRPAVPSTSRTATPRRRRSPTASGSTSTSATSACSPSSSTARRHGRSHRSVRDPQQLGHRGLARPPRQPPVHRQRQRRTVVPGRLRHAHRGRGLAGRS
jgi:hypothetical protein